MAIKLKASIKFEDTPLLGFEIRRAELNLENIGTQDELIKVVGVFSKNNVNSKRALTLDGFKWPFLLPKASKWTFEIEDDLLRGINKSDPVVFYIETTNGVYTSEPVKQISLADKLASSNKGVRMLFGVALFPLAAFAEISFFGYLLFSSIPPATIGWCVMDNTASACTPYARLLPEYMQVVIVVLIIALGLYAGAASSLGYLRRKK